MFSDLMAHFDLWFCSWCSVFVVVYFFSSVICPVFIMVSCGVFVKSSRVESLMMKVFNVTVQATQSERVASFSGSYHMISSLLIFLLGLNLMGTIPYLNSMMMNLSVAFSLSFPFWFAFSSCVFPQNFMYYFGESFDGNENKGIIWIMLMTELVSVIARPFTLGVRMCVNVAIGQVALLVIGGGVSLVFYGTGGSFCMSLLGSFPVCFVSFMVETALMLVQSAVFVTLLVAYSEDGVLSK